MTGMKQDAIFIWRDHLLISWLASESGLHHLSTTNRRKNPKKQTETQRAWTKMTGIKQEDTIFNWREHLLISWLQNQVCTSAWRYTIKKLYESSHKHMKESQETARNSRSLTKMGALNRIQQISYFAYSHMRKWQPMSTAPPYMGNGAQCWQIDQ